MAKKLFVSRPNSSKDGRPNSASKVDGRHTSGSPEGPEDVKSKNQGNICIIMFISTFRETLYCLLKFWLYLVGYLIPYIKVTGCLFVCAEEYSTNWTNTILLYSVASHKLSEGL